MFNVIPHKSDILRNVFCNDTSKSLQFILRAHSNVHLHECFQEVDVSILKIVLHPVHIHNEVDLRLAPI